MQELIANGFVEAATGGNCRALVRRRDGKTDVVTTTDGSDLPEADDWLFVTYDGDWLADAEVAMIDQLDSEMSPLSLVEVAALAAQPSTVLFKTVRIGRRSFAFTTCEAASVAYRETIERLDVGASEAPLCEILDSEGNVTGRVSYNGRVWMGADWKAGDLSIYTPPPAAAR